MEFIIENGVLKKVKGYNGETEIVVPEGVTEIGKKTFYEWLELESVTLPSTLKKIGEDAFSHCANLQNIGFPEGLETIGSYAFAGCPLLKNVILPESLKDLGTTYPRVVFNSKSTYSCMEDFRYKGYMEIRNPKLWLNDRWFQSGALWFVNRDYDTIEAKLKPAARRGFMRALENGVSVPDEVKAGYLKYYKSQRKKLYNDMLRNKTLFNLMLSEKLLAEDNVDDLLALTSEAGDTEKSAALLDYKNQFAPKKKKKDEFSLDDAPMTVGELKKIWTYEKVDGGVKLTSYKGKDTEVVMPEKIGKDTVVEISDYVFSPKKPRITPEMRRLRGGEITKVTFPSGLKKIGFHAFDSCWGLTEIEIPEHIEKIESDAFVNCRNLASVKISPKTIFGGSFHGCTLLENKNGFVVIDGILDSVRGERKVKITIPKTVKEIAYGAFDKCEKLSEIHIHKNVTGIAGLDVLYNRQNRVTVYAPAGSYAEQYARKHNINFVAE